MDHLSNTVLVAGGAGFIGSHLCDRLIRDGYKVVCMDNLYTGSMSNIRHLLGDPRFRFVNHDVTAPVSIDGLDFIFNLACPASPVHYQKDAIYTTKTAVLGTLNMLELARVNGCPLLQSSTSEVYGDPDVHPQPESYHGNVNPVGIRSCYDEGKRCAESLCMDYNRQLGVAVKIVRIFNTYGPRMAMDDGRVVSNFITQALQGKDITVYGDGTQTRSFQYIDDLIEGIVRMADSSADFTGPVNIGNYWCPLNRYNDLWNPFGLKKSRSKHYATSPSFNFAHFQEGLPKPSPVLPPNPFPGVPRIHERQYST